MTTQDEMIKQAVKKLKGNRKPTVVGVLVALLILITLQAWALMITLGIAASALNIPTLALGYWASLGLCGLAMLIRPARSSK